jgi:murein DD-endopeptidase MepM/ murein hydrolase activator NlpD
VRVFSGLKTELQLISFLLAMIVLIICGGRAYGGRDWPPRKPPKTPKPAHQLRDISRWPAEPATPAEIDAERFRQAVAYLCGNKAEQTPADEVLASARKAGVDPFLLASLMAERSRCNPRFSKNGGLGLLGLQPAMYRTPGAPPTPIAPNEWSRSSLMSVRSNLDVGARLLKMWEEQHAAIDTAFGGMAHRSAVSHFYWGDVVAGAGHEDLVLTTRRRMIFNYEGRKETPKPNAGFGMNAIAPLHTVPRVASSGPGEDRDGGRRHKGLDIVASMGEPVRAIADGTVIVAGIDQRSNPHRAEIPPEKSFRYARSRRLGPGGVYVCIRHTPPAPGDRGLVSCYMHLERYVIAKDDTVSAGQLIGFVGTSGVKESPPHLHFEVRLDDRAMNPLKYFNETIFPPKATLAHRHKLKAMRERRRAAAQAAKAAEALRPGS